MYEKLLLAAGGGIIDRVQQSEQDGNAVICIGLGGTGIDCLRNLKEKLYNRVKPDDPKATIPEYSHIKFLAIDTDLQDMSKRSKAAVNEADGGLGEIDINTEFFDISFPEKVSDLFHATRSNLAMDPSYREWLQFDRIEAGAADNGAGGIRQLGRFLFMQKSSRFVSKLQELVRKSKEGLGDCRVYIHIFAGISGGTGAGAFLDACYLVQRALLDSGTTKYKTLGYFFLPDVNLGKEGLPEQTKQYVMRNGYASLQELDYCMNFEHNGDSWHQNYPGIGEVETTNQPVELCHLISAITDDGATLPEAYRYAMNVTTDYVMDFLIKPESDLFSLESHFSNVGSNSQFVEKPAGASYDYLILGAACTSVPFKQVLTYLAAQIFAGFEGSRAHLPTTGESEAFQRSVGLTFDQVLQMVRANVSWSYANPDNKSKDARDNESLVVGWFADQTARAKGALENNYARLSKAPESYAPSAGAQKVGGGSLTAQALAGLRGVMEDPQRGPHYAEALLDGTSGSDLLSAVAGIRAEAQSRRDDVQYNFDNLHYPAYEQAQRKFEHANFFDRNKSYNEWVDANRTVEEDRAKVFTYQAVMDLMDAVSEQLQQLSRAFARPLAKTVTGLLDTFKANRDELTAFADRQNPYEMPLVTMAELMPTLNKTLREVSHSDIMRELLRLLLTEEGMRGWGPNGDDAVLAHMVSDFFVAKFNGYSQKSLTGYLEDKYGTNDPQKLATAVCNGILRQVDVNAAPLFFSETGYSTASACAISYLTVPQTAPAVERAAELLVAGKERVVIRPTAVLDRISVLRCLLGVPMWGYRGVKLYEVPSVLATAPGKHLYETACAVPGLPVSESRNWAELPSPTPLSRMGDGRNDAGVKARAMASGEVLDSALEKGVITKSAYAYELHVIADSFMMGLRAEYEAAKDRPNDEKIEAQDRLKAKAANRVYESLGHAVSSEFRDDPAIERTILLDKFAKAPVYVEMARAELAKIDEMEGYIEALEPKVDHDFETYKNALFTGVIKLEIPLVSFVDPEFGDETILSKPQMERGGVPLYQAFLSFKALDAPAREAIAAATRSVLEQNRLPEEVALACRAVSAELGRKKALVALANASFPRETADIKSLIRQLEEALTIFTTQYFIQL